MLGCFAARSGPTGAVFEPALHEIEPIGTLRLTEGVPVHYRYRTVRFWLTPKKDCRVGRLPEISGRPRKAASRDRADIGCVLRRTCGGGHPCPGVPARFLRRGSQFRRAGRAGGRPLHPGAFSCFDGEHEDAGGQFAVLRSRQRRLRRLVDAFPVAETRGLRRRGGPESSGRPVGRIRVARGQRECALRAGLPVSASDRDRVCGARAGTELQAV